LAARQTLQLVTRPHVPQNVNFRCQQIPILLSLTLLTHWDSNCSVAVCGSAGCRITLSCPS